MLKFLLPTLTATLFEEIVWVINLLRAVIREPQRNIYEPLKIIYTNFVNKISSQRKTAES